MEFEIRPYQDTDLNSIYRICLLTGFNGEDATPYLNDLDLVGHLFAAPYAIFEPSLCFVLTIDSKPCGYVLGTSDSIMFSDICENKWFPELRKRYPLPNKEEDTLENNFLRYLHSKQTQFKWAEDYPAHLHIDILPPAQKKGYGSKLITVFIKQLNYLNVKGVHLVVGKKNQNAIGFYKKVGFQQLKELEESIVFGKKL